MSTPHMPRVEAGEAEFVAPSEIVLAGLRLRQSGHTWGHTENYTFSVTLTPEQITALNPAPAPQDTAEAMAEVERLIKVACDASFACGEYRGDCEDGSPYDDLLTQSDNAGEDLLAAVRALADRATTAEAALASLRAEREVPGEWQDISTAPKDGTMVLTAMVNGGVTSSTYFRGQWGGWMMWVTPTHWRPLPEPPRTLISAQKDRTDGGKP